MIDIGAVVAGRFRVLKKLGEGGMGAVFEVENTSNGRRFALKTVHPHLMQSSAALARFEVEVRASVMVESDHVVNAVDTGVDEVTRTPWLLLELLQGQTLEAEIEARGALAPSEARWILEQLGAALVAAHTAQPQVVVHLDLKPSNVFLANRRTVSLTRVVKVLDFGLARFIDASKTAADLTSQAGTLEWMAPEQFEVGQVRPAADVWAYGLVAFFALTGRCFWKSANVSASEYRPTAVMSEVTLKPIPSASVRVQELEVDVSLPPGFDAWLARCLQREEGDRFKSAVECVPALLALLPEAGASRAPSAEPTSTRGATAVGVPSVPKDLPPIESAKPSSGPPVQRTEVMRGGPPPEPASPRGETTAAAPRPVARRLLALAVVPLLGLMVWGLTRAASTVNSCPDGMVLVRGGTFEMGSQDGEGNTDEHPRHRRQVSNFCMDRVEATVASYRSCVSAGACTPGHETVDWPGITDRERSLWSRFCNARSDRAGRDDHPMNCIDWAQAERYCTWRRAGSARSIRLPTEAEWEYAATGGGERAYPWGNEPPDESRLNVCGEECAAMRRRLGDEVTTEYSWSDAWTDTAPVGSFPRGAAREGIHDLAGNLFERTSDWYGPYSNNMRAAPNSGQYRVNRGSGWGDRRSLLLRARDRYWGVPSFRGSTLGVRCVAGVR